MLPRSADDSDEVEAEVAQPVPGPGSSRCAVAPGWTAAS